MVRTVPLNEFLINQINDESPFAEELKELITNHLESAVKGHHRKLRMKLGWSPETLDAVISELNKLKRRFH